MADSKIRLLIADDHEVVRLGLRTLLGKYSDRLDIVGDAGTVPGAIELARKHSPDLLLLDARMPGGGGAAICVEVKRFLPKVSVLFLTSFADEATIFEAIKAGANGYLLKEADSERLMEAIVQVAEGQFLLDTEITRQVMAHLHSGGDMSPQSRLQMLSLQEMRVLTLVAQGMTNKEIAAEIGLSDKTVKNYLSNAMDKLKLSRRSEAAAYYVRHASK